MVALQMALRWPASQRGRETMAQRMPKVRADIEALFADEVPAAA